MRVRQPSRHLGESQPAVAWGTPRSFAPRRLASLGPLPGATVQRFVNITQGVPSENSAPPQGNIPLAGRWIKFETQRWTDEPTYRDAILRLYKPYQAPAFLHGVTEHNIPLETLTGPLPKWYEPLDDDPAETLARRLQKAYESKGNDLYDGSSMGGVIRVVEQGNLDQYRDLGEFLVAVETNTRWGPDGGGLEDYFALREKFPEITPVAEISYPELRKLADNQEEINETMYDSPYVMIDEAIWTDGMGPCITVAMTATFEGKRYNTLLHSLNLDTEGEDIASAIEKTFDGERLPAFTELQDKKFFVVGGSFATQRKALSVLTALLDHQYDVTQATITTKPGQHKLAKALLVTPEGAVFYSAYDPKEAF